MARVTYGEKRQSFGETNGLSSDAEFSQDAWDMHRMGNKQELKRNFHSLSILGLTCVLIATWMAVLATSGFSLINGGRAGTIWVYLASWICTIPVVLSLAEMASMAPTAGGQYHWVSEFAPRRFQKPLSYLSGWLSALGWQTFVAGSAYQVSTLLLLMVSIKNPEFTPTPWQETVLMIATGIISVLFNIFGAKHIPLFEGVISFLYIIGFLAIIIPLWVIAPKAPAREVFTDFQNYGGWSSIGAAVVIGQTSAGEALLGVDSAAHMAEEVKHARKSVPRMMFLTIVLNGALGMVMLITYVFSIQDVEEQIVNSTSPYPFVGVFAKATDSSAGAIGMTVPVLMISFFACINSIMAASRQAWSFARDEGLPFPRWFMKVRSVDSTPLPVNAMLASLCILIVIALLNLGSAQIVQSLLGLLSGAVGSTYVLSISCVLWRRLFGDPLPPASFSLGWFGVPVNLFAVLYQANSTIVGFFPLFPKVTAVDMNWSVAVFGGVAILCMVNYVVFARKRYRGPVVKIVKDD